MSSLFRSTTTVGGMTLISRVLGFVRDMVIARLFGASMGADAFFVAFKIPNFMRRLFAEGAFSQAFVPVLAQYKGERSVAEQRQFVARVAGTLGGVLLLVTAIGVLAAPLLVLMFAPGFLDEPAKFQLTTEMSRLTFPYVLFVALTALAAAVLNAHGEFAAPALTPVILNLSLLAAAWWLAPQLDVPAMALAWGVLLAGVLQWFYQGYYLRRLGMLGWPRWAWRDSGVQQVIRLMVPAVIGSSVAQINLLLDTLIASFLVSGSVSWLYYADRLVEFPLGVLGAALATVILPALSAKHVSASLESFSQTLDWALRWVLLIAVPAMLGLLMLSGPIVATLFAYGQFTDEDARMASWAVSAYTGGLVAFILVKVLAPAFFARQDTRTPVRIGMIAVAANLLISAVLVVPMMWFDIAGAHAALALATALASWLNAGLLLLRLRRERILCLTAGWRRLLGQTFVANAAMVAVLWSATGGMEQWLAWGATDRVWHLILLGAGSAVVYFLGLWLVGIRMPQWRALVQQR
jgi:putative peptidoglycan lipid II flippase